jgi:hypothetical protein
MSGPRTAAEVDAALAKPATSEPPAFIATARDLDWPGLAADINAWNDARVQGALGPIPTYDPHPGGAL